MPHPRSGFRRRPRPVRGSSGGSLTSVLFQCQGDVRGARDRIICDPAQCQQARARRSLSLILGVSVKKRAALGAGTRSLSMRDAAWAALGGLIRASAGGATGRAVCGGAERANPHLTSLEPGQPGAPPERRQAPARIFSPAPCSSGSRSGSCSRGSCAPEPRQEGPAEIASRTHLQCHAGAVWRVLQRKRATVRCRHGADNGEPESCAAQIREF